VNDDVSVVVDGVGAGALLAALEGVLVGTALGRTDADTTGVGPEPDEPPPLHAVANASREANAHRENALRGPILLSSAAARIGLTMAATLEGARDRRRNSRSRKGAKWA
jgi:hypothetical protein